MFYGSHKPVIAMVVDLKNMVMGFLPGHRK
jgi:hypothetical protein